MEYEIPGAIQIAVPTTGVGEDRAKHFARALMHFVRIHPAVGMVSEVRDAEAAREVLQFIATGHQVWTTIHVADANGILFRMLDMGMEGGRGVPAGPDQAADEADADFAAMRGVFPGGARGAAAGVSREAAARDAGPAIFAIPRAARSARGRGRDRGGGVERLPGSDRG